MSGRVLISALVLAACQFAATNVVAADSETVVASANVPGSPDGWKVTRTRLTGGRSDGVEVISVDNGVMQIDVCPTRGMGILKVVRGDVELKWDSPVSEVVHPKFMNLESRGGLGWLEGFNEFMCRCGLESNGHPGTDKFVNNVGDEAEMDLTLHGKVANIPASNVKITVDKTAPFAIHVTGDVYERFMFGPKLKLQTELVVVPGETSFHLTDHLTNTGAQEQEFQLLYHANFGGPILEQGAKVIAATKKVEPFNDRAAEGLKNWNTYTGPENGFVEQVYLLTPLADENGHTSALIHNQSKDKGASISWSTKELPYLTIWKNTGAVEDGYVTGIEPGTNYPNNRSVERKAGRVPKLQPKQTRSFTLKFSVHDGAKEVAEAIGSMAALSRASEGIDEDVSPPQKLPRD